MTLFLLGVVKLYLIARVYLYIAGVVYNSVYEYSRLSFTERLKLSGHHKNKFLDTYLTVVVASSLSLSFTPGIDYIGQYSFIIVFMICFLLLKNTFEVLYWSVILISTIFLIEQTSIQELFIETTSLGISGQSSSLETYIYKVTFFLFYSIMMINRGQEFLEKKTYLALASVTIFITVFMSTFFSPFTTIWHQGQKSVGELLLSDLMAFPMFLLKSIIVIFVVIIFSFTKKKKIDFLRH